VCVCARVRGVCMYVYVCVCVCACFGACVFACLCVLEVPACTPYVLVLCSCKGALFVYVCCGVCVRVCHICACAFSYCSVGGE